MSEIAKSISEDGVSRARIVPVGGVIKRLTDVVLAVCAIGLMLPLLVFCAVAIFLASGGGVIARHRRVGFRGRIFDCLKFEISAPNQTSSNVNCTERGLAVEKQSGELRITPLGALFRKASIDELPQLFNVLRGDMSIVGPQPISDDQLSEYADQAAAYLSCKPGITGLWQVHDEASDMERVSLDCAVYSQSWSPLLDAKIAISTLSAALGPTASR
ncbi:sugar transferase [Bradyrhizobium sp. BWA-3-5]|uniref:sugar transferase n=1 Tax=Bradyrhizobium sp. BWA-3-5 TaxID=3080013 RepID=UPI00293E4BCC|nr:sugar transferase [Bradyrhizobium sp. BWA-3-5]WOH68013.1 sugar transferase [Bradyrhizobium sp. BWA-3-5]